MPEICNGQDEDMQVSDMRLTPILHRLDFSRPEDAQLRKVYNKVSLAR